MSDDPIRWAEGGGPPGGAELVTSLRRPPPLPPELRVLARARPRRVAPRRIGATFASAVVLGGLVLWVFRPAPAPSVERSSMDPIAELTRTPDAGIPAAPTEIIAPVIDEPEAPVPPVEPRVLAQPPTSTRPSPRVAHRAPDTASSAGRIVEPLALTPQATGTLRIDTRPRSEVHIDGRLVGLTPQRNITLATGTHTVTLVVPEQRIRHTMTVQIRAGQLETRVLTLEPRSEVATSAEGVAYLVIGTQPPARVAIDGLDTGQVTPTRRMSVSPGRHRITLTPEDGRTHEVVVDIPRGETVRIVRQL